MAAAGSAHPAIAVLQAQHSMPAAARIPVKRGWRSAGTCGTIPDRGMQQLQKPDFQGEAKSLKKAAILQNV